MAELVHAKFLAWRHLHLLESPFFAKADVESAVNIHKSRGMARNRGISNFQAWLDRTSMPLGELTYEVMDSLKNGTSYYVHRHTEKPRRPLLYWNSSDEKSDSFFGINGGWEVHEYVAPALRNKLRIMLKRIDPPKPVIVRKIPNTAAAQTNNQSTQDVTEKHMFVLDVKQASGSTLPKQAKITLVGFNTTQDTRPVQEQSDVILDTESRIFRAKPGDVFEVFAIPDRMKVIRKDLIDNKNLNASIANNLITALQETNTYNRPDGTIVHEMEYLITNRYLDIELLDEDDIPEAFAQYQVFDAQDELYAEGELDEQGCARVEGIDQEDALVHFPEFDQPAVVTS